MRYWKFDICTLIADYEKNKRTLASITEAITVAKGYLLNPISDDTRGEVEVYIELLELKAREFQLYTDMVALGMNDLPEIERKVLKWWLIDHKTDERIMYDAGIATGLDLQKIKEMSLAKFHDIVMP